MEKTGILYFCLIDNQLMCILEFTVRINFARRFGFGRHPTPTVTNLMFLYDRDHRIRPKSAGVSMINNALNV